MKRLFDKNKSKLRQVRHLRIRKVLNGSSSEPRLSVFRSLKGMNIQLIDDVARKTLCSVNAKEIKEKKAEDKTGKVAVSYLIGKLIAEKAKAKGISKVKFDRGGYKYHGRVKALADGARDGGLIF